MKKAIQTDRAPQAIGPYSQAVWAGDLLFVSGQIPLEPSTGNLVTGSIADQTRQVLENLHGILSSQNLGFEHVIKSVIFLTRMTDFAAVNEVYASYFKTPYPARSTVTVQELPKGAPVEIEVVARRA